MSNYYAILINTYSRPDPVDAVKAVLTEAKSWAKFSGDGWIVFTDHPPSYWYGRLSSVLHKEDSIMIAKLDVTEMAGRASNVIADWLKTDKSTNPGL